MTDSWVRFLLAPAFVFIACCLDRNYQTDLWHHLARGRVIVNEGKILDEDRFTFTVAGQPFQDVNWLSQVAGYRLHQWGGIDLLQTVNALLIAGVLAFVVALCWRSGRSMAVACAVGLFVAIGMWQLVVLIRPQTLSLVLFVLLYAVMEGSEKRPWLLLLAPLHLLLWVNVHGAFPIGLVLIGCYGFAAGVEGIRKKHWGVFHDRRVWLLAGCLTASALATLVNPYGWRVWEYVRQTSGLATARRIDEWLPPGLNTLAGIVGLLSLVALAALLLTKGRRLNLRESILLAVFLLPAVRSVRMLAWWLIIVAPILAVLIADRFAAKGTSEEKEKPNVGATITCLVLLALMLLSLPSFERWSPFRLIKSTDRVEDHLDEFISRLRKENDTGRVFTRFEWSEYLTWSIGPEFKVFMDGRIEIFPDRVWEEYTLVTMGKEGWEEVLRGYEVGYVLVDHGPYHSGLLKVMGDSKGWEPVGLPSEIATLYRRRVKEKK